MAEIPQKLFFRIGEVCDLIQVQPHVLRYWETEFPTLAPQKNRAGQRVYRRKDVEMVMRIHDLLYIEKFTIAGARKRLLEEVKKGSVPRLKSGGREKAPEFERVQEKEVSSDLEMDVEFDSLDSLPDDFDDLPEVETQAPSPAASSSMTTSEPPKPASLPAPTSNISNNLPVQASENSPRTQRALRVIRHELEGLLTLLKSDAKLNRSV